MVSQEILDDLKGCKSQEEFVEVVAREQLTEPDIVEAKEEILRWAIGNFSSPLEYSHDDYFMHPMVRMAILKEATELHSYFYATGYERLSALAERYNVGVHSFLDDEPNPYLCIFIFLSVQDGMMTWLCDHLDESQDPNGYHSIRRKRSVLAREYRENIHEGDRVDSPFGTGDVIANLENIWEHRNEIMHGGPNAVFDMNIATVCLLFTVVTFEVIFEYRDIEPVEVPKEWMLP